MIVNSLKDFNKLITLCRKLGVERIRVGDVEVTLGAEPLKKVPQHTSTSTSAPYLPANEGFGPITEADKIETEELTEEQLLMWSSGGREDAQ